MIQELNTFYLKAMLWVPPNHSLNLYRELLYAFGGACAVKELYDYLSSTYVLTHTHQCLDHCSDIVCTPLLSLSLFLSLSLSLLQ